MGTGTPLVHCLTFLWGTGSGIPFLLCLTALGRRTGEILLICGPLVWGCGHVTAFARCPNAFGQLALELPCAWAHSPQAAGSEPQNSFRAVPCCLRRKWQSNSFCAPPHCLRGLGTRKCCALLHFPWLVGTCSFVLCNASLLGSSGHCDSFWATPPRLVAMGRETPFVHCDNASEQWAPKPLHGTATPLESIGDWNSFGTPLGCRQWYAFHTPPHFLGAAGV